MPEKDSKKIISVREAAKECGRNTETVRRWIWSGKLPAEKLGNQLFIKRTDLAAYCREAAIAYDAGTRPEISSKLKHLKEHFDNSQENKEVIIMKAKNRADLIKRMRKLREEIYARTGKTFNVETMIHELREERVRDTR